MRVRTLVVAATFAAILPCAAFAQSAGGLDLASLMARIAAIRAQIEAYTKPPQHPCPSLYRELRIGMRGEDVRALQFFLVDKGLLAEDKTTGFFGTLTESAVKVWQRQVGIAGLGIVGAKTRASMIAACPRALPTIRSTSVLTALPPPQPASTTSAVLSSISILSPSQGMVTAAGRTFLISWLSQNPPMQSSVTLSLLNQAGGSVGTIASLLPTSGSYNWRIPQEQSDCQAGTSAFDCISQLGSCSGGDTSGLCNIIPGTYAILARLGASITTTSFPFSIGGSASDIVPLASVPESGGSVSTTTSPLACMHEGRSFPEGTTMTVACSAGHCPSGSGYITGECKAARWCIPYTSTCAASFDQIDVSAYEGTNASAIGSGHGVNCPQPGWRAYLECPYGGCVTGWNMCTAGGWIFDPDQSVH